MDSSSFELEIASFAFGGMAVGRMDTGKVCFVRGAAPGERVLAKTVADKPSHRVATLLSVLRPSPRRIEPFCPLACRPDERGLGESSLCPGCSYQHVPYEDELAAKDAQLRDFVKRWLKLEPESVVKPPCGAPSRQGWRNKIVLSCDETPKGLAAGYKASDNKTLIPVESCPLACGEICELMKRELSKPGAAGAFEKGQRLSFRHTKRDGALFWARAPEKGLPPLEESLPQGVFKVPRGSFFQVNREVAGALLEEFAKEIEANPPELLLDMYCGVGVFAVAGALAGARKAFGCELDASAIEAAKENAKNAGLSRCEFVSGDAAKLFKRFAGSKAGDRTTLTLDPPRGGLEKKALEGALAVKASRVVYVSCAADALCRDLKLFLAAGYQLRSMKLFDMFPSTAHFETLAVLEMA